MSSDSFFHCGKIFIYRWFKLIGFFIKILFTWTIFNLVTQIFGYFGRTFYFYIFVILYMIFYLI